MVEGNGDKIDETVNHPLAWRMAGIAIVSQNVTIGCLMGSFSVMLATVEQRMAVDREMSSLAMPLITTGVALLAPFVGGLASRHSLRMLWVIGALLSLAGFATLALTNSYPLYLAAYGLMLGPGMSLVGVVLPSTLIAQWFTVHRGRALGLTHMPVFIVLVPVMTSWLLERYGPVTTYLALAAITTITVLPLAFLVRNVSQRHELAALPAVSAKSVAPDGIPLSKLLGMARLWTLGISAAIIVTGSVILTSHLVPMAALWGFDGTCPSSKHLAQIAA